MRSLLLALALLVALALPARAQTLVLLAKGQVVSPPELAAVAVGSGTKTSAAFGWFAYDAIQIMLVPSDPIACTFTNVAVTVSGAYLGTATFDTLADTYAVYNQTTLTQFSYFVGNTLPYLKVTLANFGGSAAPCSLTVKIIPIPLSPVNFPSGRSPRGTPLSQTESPVVMGGVNYGTPPIPYSLRVNASGYAYVNPSNPSLETTTPITLVAATTTTIFTLTNTQPCVRVMNTGTDPVFVAAGTNAASLTSSRYSLLLRAGTVAGDGTGGSERVCGQSGDTVRARSTAGSSVAIHPE